MTTVLVTGVGAVTGYGVLRDLRDRRPGVRLVGTDLHADAVGAHWCDTFLPCPAAADPGYGSWLRGAVRDHAVDLVLPTLDADLDFFRSPSESAAAVRNDTTVALNSEVALTLGRDKLALDRALDAHGDPARIPTSTATDFDELRATLGVPFLVKPRHGYGSRGIVTVAGPDDLAPHVGRLGDDRFAQQIVGSADDEYTVGAFGDGRGRFRARIVMRRRLASWGTTRHVEVVEPPAALDATLERLAPIVDPCGPTNLQLRRVDDRWLLLEINARVSSSTSLRARFGYHEAEMTLDFALGGEVPAQPAVRLGTATRYLEDLVTS